MQQILRFGLAVVTSDGREAGSLHRVVIDEPARRVTAIAVQRGLIESGNLLKPGGWEKARDQRVEFAAVTGADEREVRLSLTEQEFLALPPYVVGEVPEGGPDWTPPPSFEAEDIAMRMGSMLGGGLYQPPRDEVENRGPNDRHLSHGADVWRREPHTHLGTLAALLMDDVTNAVTAFVISRRNVLLMHEVVLPITYLADLLDDLVHVDIPDADLKALVEYRPSP